MTTAVFAACVVVLGTGVAYASWSLTGSGSGSVQARAMGAAAGLTADTTTTPGSVLLSWTAPSSSSSTAPVTGYQLTRFTSATGTAGQTSVCADAVTSSATSCTDSTAAVGTAYFYSVAAVYTAAGATAPQWLGTATAPRTAATPAVALAVSTPDLKAADDTGSSSSDNVTKSTTPSFTGTATPGTTVTIFDGSTQVGSGSAPTGTYDIQVSALAGSASGVPHSISAKATLASTTVNSSGSLTVTVDTSVPAAVFTSTPSNPTTAASANFTWTESESGTSFTCSLDGATASSCVSGQNYSSLSKATHTFALVVTDVADNTQTTTYTWVRGN